MDITVKKEANLQAIILLNSEGVIKSLNQDIEDILGYQYSELYNKNIQHIIDDKTFKWSNFTDSNKNENRINITLPDINFLKNDGHYITSNLKITSFYNQEAEKTYCLSILKVYKCHQESEHTEIACRCQYKHTISVMPNPYIFIKAIRDENGEPVDCIILDTNKKFMELYNLNKQDLIGKRAIDLFPHMKLLLSATINQVEALPEKEKLLTFEYHSKTINRWFLIATHSPEKDYYSFVGNDITYLKESESALKQMQYQQKAILDNIPSIAWLKDRESTLLAVNESYAEKCGVPVIEVIGKTDYDYFPFELATLYVTDDKKVMRSKKRLVTEEPFIGIDGKKTYIETCKTPVFDDVGDVIGTAGIAHDITERKNMEIALRESEIRYRELFNNMSSAVAVIEYIEKENKFIFKDYNRGAERIDNLPKNYVLGKDLLKVFPEYEDLEILNKIKNVWTTNTPEYIKDLYYTGHNVQNWRDYYIYKLPTKEIIAVYNDISERKETEKIRENFIATLSHDLRVPLLAENHTLKYMLKGTFGPLSNHQEVAVDNMINSNSDLINLVNTLLDVFKYESETIELHKKNINIFQLVEECLMEIESLINSQNKIVKSHIKEDIPNIYVDRKHIKRVLYNLISNAINYTPDNSIIEIDARIKKYTMKITIKDNGKGISEEDISKIFDRYYSSSKKFRKVGTGLGLYLSRQIVEAHGGNIWAESKPNQGSIFYIELPI